MVDSGNQRSPSVRDHYFRILSEIMRDYKIEYRDSDYAVGSSIGFREAVQHTDRYLSDRNSYRSHYRYERYIEALRQRVKLNGMRRVAHIDIGCGAGLFSWVFLDWAVEKGFGYDRIDLYGYDHSSAMIDLATECKYRLTQTIPNYPSLHYDHNIEDFLRRIKMAWRPDTDYIISFGHVLAQSYIWTRSSIKDFARIAGLIMQIKSLKAACEIIAVDAKGWAHDFGQGWNLLLRHLTAHRILRAGTPETSLHTVLTEKTDDIPYWHDRYLDEPEYDLDKEYNLYSPSPLYEEYDVYNEDHGPYALPDWRSDTPWDDEELPWESKLPQKQTDDLPW